jgi:hypothetical protein
MIYLLALVAIIIALLVELKYLGIKKRIDVNGTEITRLRTEVMNFRIETKARDYNARKRNENLLREIHKSSHQNNVWYGAICDASADNNIKLDGISKLCRGIDGVARQCANSDIDFLAFFKKLDKHEREGMRILNLFEETLEKAKKTGRGK